MTSDTAPSLQHALDQLREILAGLRPAFVAFSAGVDSTFLLDMAQEVLGKDVAAVTADSPSLARSSLAEAQAFCQQRGISHHLVQTHEFESAVYRENSGDRCYACKAALFQAMRELASSMRRDYGDAVHLIMGAVSDDFSDVRPGMRAAAEAGVRWPLIDAGMSKAMVRQASRDRGLASWNRPAEPCLSSRVPYGEVIEPAGLAMIEAAEALLRAQGFAECRARHHRVGGDRGFLCRIEVPVEELSAVLEQRPLLLQRLREIGYRFVSLDLAGLQSGAFNSLLPESAQ